MSGSNEIYTHGHAPVVVAEHAQRTAAEAAAFALPRFAPGMTILDIGCGPGSITVGLADHIGPTGTVVGIDNSPEAVEIARRTHRGNAAVTFEEASIYALPFADDSFDAAYGHQILQHLGDPVAALKEVLRVLRPGGLIAVRDADYGTMNHYPPSPDLDTWLNLYRAVARANGGEPDAGRRLPSWVRTAGYRDLTVTTSTWTYTTADQRISWAQLWAERTMLPRFADRAVDLNLCRPDELERIAAAWHTWAADPDGWFAFVHGEVVASKPG